MCLCVPLLRRSLHFSVRVFPFLPHILYYLYFSIFFSMWSIFLFIYVYVVNDNLHTHLDSPFYHHTDNYGKCIHQHPSCDTVPHPSHTLCSVARQLLLVTKHDSSQYHVISEFLLSSLEQIIVKESKKVWIL